MNEYATLEGPDGSRVRIRVLSQEISWRSDLEAGWGPVRRLRGPTRVEYSIRGVEVERMPSPGPAGPLGELLAALKQDGKPPLAWIVEHAPTGDLQRVWGTCDASTHMVQVLERARHPKATDARRAAQDAWSAGRDGCPAVRRVVPVPPTLQELLTATEATPGVR